MTAPRIFWASKWKIKPWPKISQLKLNWGLAFENLARHRKKFTGAWTVDSYFQLSASGRPAQAVSGPVPWCPQAQTPEPRRVSIEPKLGQRGSVWPLVAFYLTSSTSLLHQHSLHFASFFSASNYLRPLMFFSRLTGVTIANKCWPSSVTLRWKWSSVVTGRSQKYTTDGLKYLK